MCVWRVGGRQLVSEMVWWRWGKEGKEGSNGPWGDWEGGKGGRPSAPRHPSSPRHVFPAVSCGGGRCGGGGGGVGWRALASTAAMSKEQADRGTQCGEHKASSPMPEKVGGRRSLIRVVPVFCHGKDTTIMEGHARPRVWWCWWCGVEGGRLRLGWRPETPRREAEKEEAAATTSSTGCCMKCVCQGP